MIFSINFTMKKLLNLNKIKQWSKNKLKKLEKRNNKVKINRNKLK